MYLSQKQAADFDRDGYVLMPNLFSEKEVEIMLSEVEGGGRVADHAGGLSDAGGKKAKLALWTDIGEDVWAAASTCPRVVNTARMLMREDLIFYHGKVMLKEAHSGGAWEWHQDYGYWYNYGFLLPQMISIWVALDAATIENGCLQVLRGSHKMGRIDHQMVGGQTGAEPERITQVEPFFERVHCEMTPGSALFFHCNLLHSSAPNESDKHRRSFIMCYSTYYNQEVGPDGTIRHRESCPVTSDDAILKFAR